MVYYRIYSFFAILYFFQFSPVITSPRSGDVLRGLVIIYGQSGVVGFISSDLEYAYSDDPTNTWFIITQFMTPTSNDSLAAWDTSSLSDGVYDLRLRVHMSDGSTMEALVNDLVLCNHSSCEPSVPLAGDTTITPTVSLVAPSISFLSPAPQVTNPVSLPQTHIFSILGYVLLFVIAFYLCIFIYNHMRRN